MRRNRVFWVVVACMIYLGVRGEVWSQRSDLISASQAVARRRFVSAVQAQLRAFQDTASVFLRQVESNLPLPQGMLLVEKTNSYYFQMGNDFADFEYRFIARLSNENVLMVLTWYYSPSYNERSYNLVKSLPYLTQGSLWWQNQTNRGVVYTIWREKDVYSYFRIVEEKENTLQQGFLITIQFLPIKKISSQTREQMIWEYIMKSDWRSLERLLR
ncbi:hypothetical protein [Thermospira aquatica]|uniref:Uncharacterized protein n=1 Tax=Thermospira aquatica TaxID=2828656 RepID=A0AAX3BD93_9SPIR|nr:hypothetical protein [Thermospira aquatica]URA10282.1 hypothetical protein KDW03_00305 [Thermospira aquatica]